MTNTAIDQNKLRIVPVGHTLSVFLVITYLLCVIFGLLVPAEFHMYQAWTPLLPGFEWLTWPGFLFGLVDSYVYGWYIAVLFVPLFRFFARRF
jgi:hypothetical protein